MHTTSYMHNWEDIRYFIEVARLGSYSAAAHKLKVNHTTVSRRIRSLEQNIGAKLFISTSQGFAMTNAAQAVFAQASSLEQAHQCVARTLTEYNDLLSGQIHLTMPHDLFTLFLAETLAEFRQLYPDVDLTLSLTNDLKDIAAKETDIAVRISQPPDNLIGTRIATLQGGVYANRKLDTAKPVGIILWEGETEIPPWALDNFASCYCSLKVNDLASMHAAINAGFGVAAMPAYLPEKMAGQLVENDVVRLDINVPENPWGLWVLTHVEVRQAARIRVLKDHLIRALNNVKNSFG